MLLPAPHHTRVGITTSLPFSLHANVQAKARDGHWGSAFYLPFLRQRLSLNLEVTIFSQLGWPLSPSSPLGLCFPRSCVDSGDQTWVLVLTWVPQLLGSFSLLPPIEHSLRPHGKSGFRSQGGPPFLACSEVSSTCSICIFSHPCGHFGPVVICAGAKPALY